MDLHLVTGATGHIGNVLVRKLLAQGKQVRALVMPGENTASLADLPVETMTGDVLDLDSLYPAFEGVRDVYHLAGIISIIPGENRLVTRVNVDGTQNMLCAAASAGVRRLVYTSSIHAMERAPEGIVGDENLPFNVQNPLGAYDRSKAQASVMVQQAAANGLDAVLVCPTGVIGPYDFRRSEMGQLIYDCARGKPQLYVEGAYDFVDVRDVADGILLANEKGKTGENYILSGERMTVRALFQTVRKITGRAFPWLKVPYSLARFVARFTPLYYRLAKIRPQFTLYSLEVLASNSHFSSAKARRELGYSPRPLQQSISDTIHWFLENRQKWTAQNIP